MDDLTVLVVNPKHQTLALEPTDGDCAEVDDGDDLRVHEVVRVVVFCQPCGGLTALLAEVYRQFVHVFPGLGKLCYVCHRPDAHLNVLQEAFGVDIRFVDSHSPIDSRTDKTIPTTSDRSREIQTIAVAPSGMRVAVGSLNPVKEDATAQALDDADITTVDVDSGVSEQPRGRAETIEGAENRAAAALAATDCEYGVGIEGGVAEVEGTDGLYLVMWAVVTDGEQWGRGGGPTLRLPATIADRIRDGEELGPVLDDHLDTEGIARNEGAVGVFTDGLSDRASALAAAVSAAAGQFVSDSY